MSIGLKNIHIYTALYRKTKNLPHTPTERKKRNANPHECSLFCVGEFPPRLPSFPTKEGKYDMTQAEMDTQIQEIEKQMVEYVKSGLGGLPDLPFCDMVLFIGMKYLYIAFKNGMATKEEISTEKKRLIASYKIALVDDDLYKAHTRLRNRISAQLCELEKCGCENCRKLIRIFDGRDRRE